MNKPSHIFYTDAYYILEEVKELETSLPQNEAFGYIENKDNKNIIIHFIKKVDDENKLSNQNNNTIIKGLILPINAILSNKPSYIKELDLLKVGQHISVTWNDVVLVSNNDINECSVMYTEGLVFKNNSDHLVMKNPETIRTYPLPIQNHPKIKPLYYIIPKAIINSFEIIKNN